MFYRSGWLRCDVFICVCSVLSWWMVEVWYYIIYYHTYTIIIYYIIIHILLLYLILYYTLFFQSSFPSYSSLPLLTFPSSNLPSLPSHISSSTSVPLPPLPILLSPLFPSSILSHPSQFLPPNIHSILVGCWIRLFMFQDNPPNLTPHVLSEWMVEVWCVYLCLVLFYRSGWCSVLRWGVILYYTTIIILYYTIIIHILLYIISYILYSPSSPLLFFCSLLLLFPYNPLLFSSSVLSSSQSILISSSQPFYTCRYLLTVIYVLSVSNNSTPHVLSEWMVEVCGKYLYRV